jgi:uncharacterized protein VirK/YbjX
VDGSRETGIGPAGARWRDAAICHYRAKINFKRLGLVISWIKVRPRAFLFTRRAFQDALVVRPPPTIPRDFFFWNDMRLLSTLAVQAAKTIYSGHLTTSGGRASASLLLRQMLANPRASLCWFGFLQSNELARRQRHLSQPFIIKALTKYLNRNYSFGDRVRTIVSHYEFLTREFCQKSLTRIYFGRGLVLANFLGRSGAYYTISLGTYSVDHPEGELLIKIESNGKLVCFAIFSIGSVRGGIPRLEIGCIQGARPDSVSQVTKVATSDFYSMRPKHLLIAVLYEFAQALDIRSLVCVSAASHINPHNSFSVRYDPLLIELNGQIDASGFYRLPTKLSHRDQAIGGRGHPRRHRKRTDLKETIGAMVQAKVRDCRSTR